MWEAYKTKITTDTGVAAPPRDDLKQRAVVNSGRKNRMGTVLPLGWRKTWYASAICENAEQGKVMGYIATPAAQAPEKGDG